MYGMVSWFARNSVAANLLMVVAFVGGLAGYFQMERELFPQATVNGASVSVGWPGASPQDVEEQLVTRIEEVVADIDGLERITSIAREGGGVVNVKAFDNVDMDAFLREVERRVNQINNLPDAAFRPQISQWEQRNWYFGMVVHGNVDELTLKRIADDVRDELAQTSGGTLGQVGGVLDEMVSINVSEEALRRYNLSFEEIGRAIRQSSLNASGGRIRSDVGDVPITTRQLADTQEEFEDIIIRQDSREGTLRLGDVAEVVDGFVDSELRATYNDRLAAFVFFPSPDQMSIVEYADEFKAFIERANDPRNGILPEGVQVDILWDDSESFNARMNLITTAALQGAGLVLLVLILFLRPIVAFWVTVGIMTAFFGGIMLLPYLGVSWNMLSTFAVLLVIGVIVDDAIVVGENIHKEVESGRREGVEAAVSGTQMVLKPVVFGVLTTIIAFLPWAFLSGGVRAFTQQITFVVIAALTFSIIESMFILPAHLAHMKKQRFDGPLGPLLKVQRAIADSLMWFASNVYKPLVEAAVLFRYATVALFVSLFAVALTAVFTGLVPFKFQPEIENDLIQATIDMPPGTPFSRISQVRDQLAAGVAQQKAEYAREYPELPDGLIVDASIVATGGQIQAWIGLAPPETRPDTVRTQEVSEALRDAVGPIQDAEEVNFNFTFNEADNGIRFTLSHTDIDRLRAASADVQAQLATYATTFDIGDSLTAANDELQLTLRPGAETLGVTLADVSRQVGQAYFGELLFRLPRDGEDVEVRLRLPQEARESLDSLENLRIRTADGRQIPFAQVAEATYAPGIDTIVRRNQTRSVSVFADISGDGAAGEIQGDMARNFWPGFEERFPGIERGVAGGFEQTANFFSEIQRFGIIALVAMYILLAIAFRSYSQPLLLMTALPFAYAGAVFGHMAFGVDMAMFSFFGIAAAAGVVINDNLVLVDQVNRRRESGSGAVQALVDAGVSRFRPILLTSVTTFVGILPMLAERSVQAQFLKPMLVALGSAVAFALFVSLLLVPALYAVGVEIGRFSRWIWKGEDFQAIGASYEGDLSGDEIPEGEVPDTAPPSGSGPGRGLQPAE